MMHPFSDIELKAFFKTEKLTNTLLDLIVTAFKLFNVAKNRD